MIPHLYSMTIDICVPFPSYQDQNGACELTDALLVISYCCCSPLVRVHIELNKNKSFIIDF